MSGGDWDVPPQVLTIPPFAGPNDQSIIIGQSAQSGTVYAELAALYAPGVVVGAIIQQESRFDYVYLAYVNPTIGPSFWAVGGIESVGLVISEAFRVAPGTIGSVCRTIFNGRVFLVSTTNEVSNGAVFTIVSGGTIAIALGGAYTIDGVSAPRGRKDFVSSTASTGAIGAETVTLTGNSITWVAGRAYEVIFHNPALNPTVGGITALQSIRRNNVAGTLVANVLAHEMNATAGVTEAVTERVIIRNNTGSDINDNIVLTLTATASTITSTAGSNRVRYMEIRDCGAAADYPNGTQI